MDFLKEYGFDDELIKKIRDNNDDALIHQLIVEEENAKDIIDYFNSIGIKVIDQLLIHRIDLFSMDLDYIKSAFDNVDMFDAVKNINEDIDYLFEM